MRVRYYGHMGERTGYGKAAEHYVRAMAGAGIQVEAVNINGIPWCDVTDDVIPNVNNPADWPWEVTNRYGKIDAVIVHTMPLSCRDVLARLTFKPIGNVLPHNPSIIALTTWEALTMDTSLSDEICDNFDEVWTHSHASAKAITGAAQLDKVHVVPLCMPERDLLIENHPKRNPEGRFRFYWIGAWNARKNPSGLIRAFVHAFAGADDVELYLHSHGTPVEALAAELAATGIPAREGPRVVLNNDYLDDDTMKVLHARGDCFVSAARGEAWNLPAFEAMVQRKLIVTTENLGSDDFLVDTSARRVMARRAPAWNTLSRPAASHGGQVGAEIVGAQGLTSRELWLEPDLLEFGRSMRRVYERWLAGERELTINYDIAGRFGYGAVAKTIINRLENLT